MGELERYAQNLAQFSYQLTHPDFVTSPLRASNMTGMHVAILFVFSCMILHTLWRMASKDRVVTCCGFFSYKNETAHLLCALGMIAMVTPPLLALQYPFLAVVFALVALGYGIFLAQTTDKPSRLWRSMHVADGLGMSVMFLWMSGVSWHPWLIGMFVLVYIFSTCYFAYWTYEGITETPISWLALGSDFFHTARALVMLLMFMMPETFMWGHQPTPDSMHPESHQHHHH